MDKRLLTKQEFADYWGVSASTVDTWMANGKVKPLRTPGGAPRFVHPEDERNSPFVGATRDA